MFNFLIIILILLYILYLRFIPYTIIQYGGYAVPGNSITSNLYKSDFDVEDRIKAIKVNDQEQIFEKLNSFYIGTDKKEKINIEYPIYVNDSLAICNLSSNVKMITDNFQVFPGYSGSTITSGALYNTNSLQRADFYNYILLKNEDNLFINTEEILIKTISNEYIIPLNSIINFSDEFITYYYLENDEFVFNKIIDIDENSEIIINDFNKKFTYNDFLIGIGIIEEKQEYEELEEVDEKTNNKVIKVIKKKKPIIIEQEVVQNKPIEIVIKSDKKQSEEKIDEVIIEPEAEPEIKEEENIIQDIENGSNTPVEVVWIKPTVECSEFNANVYSADTKLVIKDPSRVIYKNVTFTFYKNGKIAFRSSATMSGDFKVTKLEPNCKYEIVGTFQYSSKDGSLLENTFCKQEITTQSVDKLNPIELSITNGKIYSSKIEFEDLHIESNIDDDAINGVKNAQIIINDVEYSIDNNTLKSLLKGKNVKYQPNFQIPSNTKCDYEIKFFDTVGNEMVLSNNKGTTLTSKAIPSVKVSVSNQEIIKTFVEFKILNTDEVDLENFSYVLYSNIGEIVSKGNINNKEISKLEFSDLNPQYTYTIKFYADYDISDGNGFQTNQEIGNSTFTTLSLNKLGNVKMEINYNEDTDLKNDSIKLNFAINTAKTDNRLLQILKNVNIQIQNEKREIIKEFNIIDLDELKNENGMTKLINGLKSNTTYNIVITSIASQGDVEESIGVAYTLKNFITNKKSAKLSLSNLIVTNKIIDMDIYVEDVDGACIDDSVVIGLFDVSDKEYIPDIEPETIKKTTEIPTNTWVRLTYNNLYPDQRYQFYCSVKSYNETNNKKKIVNNHQVYTNEFITTGLSGTIDLLSMDKTISNDSKNLINAKSEVNWYSQCFDILKTKYYLTEDYIAEFEVESKYNYGKKCTEKNNNIELELLSNQCYVYNLTEYKGQTVTISFLGKTSDELANVYLQKGKVIGQNLEKIEGINKDGYKSYQQTLNVPDDGYLGFFLEPIILNQGTEEEVYKDYYFYVDSLQVELGSVKTSYVPYSYLLESSMKINFLDINKVTYDSNDRNCKYYIRIKSNKNEQNNQESSYIYEGTDLISEIYTYGLIEGNQKENFVAELVIKQYGREYVLDEVSFDYDPNNCTEIKSITTKEEFKDIQPYGNYIILNDLDLRNENNTFGSPKIPFYGSIDFYGKNVKKNTYSKNDNSEITSYMFYQLGESAIIKNIVIDFFIDNQKGRYTKNIEGTDQEIAYEDGIYSLFLYNDGNINNVMINLKECSEKTKINVALMGYRNSGTIEDFIIRYEERLLATKNIAGICMFSTGVIQNGYLFGEGIETVGAMAQGSYRNVAGMVFQLEDNALMQNIYNLSGVLMHHQDSTYSYGSNIVFNVGYPPVVNEQTGQIVSTKNSTAKVKNVYSTEPVETEFDDYTYYGLLDESNKENNIGPNILYMFTNTKVDGSRYFCDVTYDENEYNTKSPATSLYEPGVQDVILNTGGYHKFIIDKFVTNGYYPHLELNYCMPEQTNIRIDIKGIEVIDVLSGTVIENNDINNLEVTDKVKNEVQNYISENNVDLTDENISILEFRVYNPAGTTITEINMNFVDCKIMSQSYSKKVSNVYVVFKEPTSFLNEYDVQSIRSKRANGKVIESKYGEMEDLGRRIINCRFIKYISTAQEWNAINYEDENGVSGLIQNYRIIDDINFAISEYTAYISGTFKGFIDGKYNGIVHTLYGIEGSKSVIEYLDDCIIQNINVDGFIINTSSQKAGFIQNVSPQKNVVIDNIHIKDMEIISSYSGSNPYYGGIVGYLYSDIHNDVDELTIKNCGIQNFSIEFKNIAVNGVCVGGIIGYSSINGGLNEYIINCFVQNFNVEADVTSTSGIGGILGYGTHNSDTSIKAGYPNRYITNCYSTGRINTKIKAGGICGWTRGSTSVEKCYSLITLNSTTTSGNVNIAGIVGYDDTGATGASRIKNNIYLGNIYVAGNSVGNLNRILGNNTGTTAYKNYACLDQIMNGETSTAVKGATKLLTFEEIYSLNTYLNLLEFDQNYAFKQQTENGEVDLLKKGSLPLLNDTYNNFQPYQKYNILDNDLKLDSIISTPSADKTEVTVSMKFENPNNLILKSVIIENDDMVLKPGTWSVTKDAKGLSVVTFVALPNKAFDSYKIATMLYERNGEIAEKEILTKIKVELYRTISNSKEWNQFFDGEGRRYPGQNIKITGNIDFSTESYISKGVTIGRLQADQKYTISNVIFNVTASNSFFISEIKTSLGNIDFENCKIEGKGNYNGIIGILRGGARDCKFNNIIINFPGNDYIGIISRCISGSFNNVNINNIKCYGRSYVGGLCGKTESMGGSSNIKGTYLYINGTGTYVGGILGYSTGSITNIQAYQYSEDGKKTGDTETGFLVKGGVIGRYNGTSATLNTVYTKYSIINGSSNVGGNVGYTYGNTKNLYSINNNIRASGSYAGGNSGYMAWYSNNTYSSQDNIIYANYGAGGNIGGVSGDISSQNSNNNQISGNNCIGGSVGVTNYYGSVASNLRVFGNNTKIQGNEYVGGTIGKTTCRVRNLKAEDAQIIGTGRFVGGLVGRNEYTTTSISATSNGNYSLAGGYAKNLIIRTNGDYVGGVVGYEIGTIYGTKVENCMISTSSNYAGGIAGYYSGYNGSTGSQLSASTYFMWNSIVTDSNVKSKNYAGGLVGNFVYGNIQYCYVANSSVIADTNGAGGLIGYFDNSKMNNLQYKATVKYNFIANTDDTKNISASNSVGGLIGVASKKLNYDEDVEKYNNIECNLIVTDLNCVGANVDMGIGSVSLINSGNTQSVYMNNIYAYNCSSINSVQIGGIIDEVNSYNLVSSDEMKTSAFFTRNVRTDDGNEGLNFGTGRHDYSNGFFPTLKTKYSNSESYWASNYLNVTQTKIAIPNRVPNFSVASLQTLNDVSSNVGIQSKSMMLFSLARSYKLPDVYVYSSDIDKINIEFESIDSNVYFEIIKEDEKYIEKQPITERIYTLNYNYNFDFKIRIFNGDFTEEVDVIKDMLQNKLDIKEGEYFYIYDNKLMSNKRQFEGEFVNLYEGKVLDKDGIIHNLITLEEIGKLDNENIFVNEIKPLFKSEYEGTIVETFYHCTKITKDEDSNFKNKQIIIKNGKIYLIDGDFENIGNSIILDYYNGKQYEATLGNDGIIYNLLTGIKFPNNFKNSEIISMTNNVNNNENIVLVYYSNGQVIGFNYITGELVFDNNVEEKKINLLDDISNNFNVKNNNYEINKVDYENALILVDCLDKYPIEEVLETVKNKNEESEKITQEYNEVVIEENKNETQYIPTYNSGKQDYEVYSTTELFNPKTTELKSENYKINNNEDLIYYYSELSENKKEIKNIGVIVITATIATIGVILLFMYKKINN